ncbi:release factor glutamine methyltransferase [Herbihabitans rhizosphaerae]|uniref:peptide chain release factor N(5)-glutamine methyltransferase n=1 Tax=Herbihabitans rhizosphaerae TaxID=1872711 RepID=A0A4Q7KMM9_9PSEU|nr:putative protein N(5)-glutamine methyltransferase [Herbihabitans rhizosphaerae]RZS37566.1 release factor glutamine methyltransferase [Herbihabitans rhizosphaerae]
MHDVVTRLRAAGCVFAEDEARLLIADAATPARLEELITRRIAGEPLEHLLGWVEFLGRRMIVAPGVFVPRRRTETLARQAIELAEPGGVVVDMCCGCGAVGAAVAASVDVELHAADIDPVAVGCAERNLAGLGHAHVGDLFEPLPEHLRGRVDVVVANVPYVPTEEIAMMPPEARDHEPKAALDGGTDGLDVARRVIAGATDWLADGGHVLFETSVHQVPAAVESLARHGFGARVVSDEDVGATVVIGVGADG